MSRVYMSRIQASEMRSLTEKGCFKFDKNRRSQKDVKDFHMLLPSNRNESGPLIISTKDEMAPEIKQIPPDELLVICPSLNPTHDHLILPCAWWLF